MGPHRANIIAQAKSKGVKLADSFQIQEELPDDLYFVYQAFWDLDTCRSRGYGMGPIPWVAINEYALRYSVNDFDYFTRIILAMDTVYLEENEKKQEAARKFAERKRGGR